VQKIHIDNPCSENWKNMTPLAEGRLCHSCNTAVIDFTQKTEKEILDYFEKRKDEHFCGQYKASSVTTPRSLKFKWILIALSLIFGAGFISSCRRHVKGRYRFPVQTKAKTEISTPQKHAAASH
jgi:hypothetical protein